MHVLFAHASVHGSSGEIAAYMAALFEDKGIAATVAHVDDIQDIRPYDAVILGAPIHAGLWVKPMLMFIRRFQTVLESKLVAAWLTCIRLLEPGALAHVHEYYVPVDLERFPLIYPVGLFVGKLNMQEVNAEERWLLYARYDGLPLTEHQSGDFRDWDAIRDWTLTLAERLTLRMAHKTL